ncbi:MAG: indolepyruvate ferredoxin oxidoreductase family protein [Rhodosalinus sp.]
MTIQKVSLSDRLDITKSPVLLNGTQALVRLMLTQKARDRRAGLNTAGYVTGYRGSPLGAVDMQMTRAQKQLAENDIRFHPGLNEDLALTAVWGSQQAGLRGEGKYDGVFALWYGKGPGVDRSGDAMRHFNMAGTDANGGAIMVMGDDHTGESSTTCHQSDWALVDAHMPVLSPAGVQEILDYGVYGYGLSRYAGVCVGLKAVKDTVEATAVVDGRPDRMQLVTPDFPLPEGGLNIRLGDHWVPQEERLLAHKRYAAEAFARANDIDKRIWGRPGAKIGFVSAGKNWLDLVHALTLLGIDEAEAERLGITTYKVGQVWPLDMEGFKDWAEGLDLIVVVEEKRKLLEVQIKEAIFDDRRGRRVYGGRKNGEVLFPTHYALDPVDIAAKLGAILIEEGRETDAIRAGLERLEEARRADNAQDIAARLPYFCAGCPHNTSTRVPEGSRAGAGIGCHTMALWMDRATEGFTHMGAEGANWIGEAPFSTRDHVFQNLGDGTYNHSGTLAIRAAIAAGVNITYKILYNDAVAMTGGQPVDGPVSVQAIAHASRAEGVERIALVSDAPEKFDPSEFPRGVTIHHRRDLDAVQRDLREVPGVSVLIYEQMCATEKRRKRKRGQIEDPKRFVMINELVCEGCGDCSVESNCLSVEPLETEFGRKRQINQSTCNKDFSCLNGFCPSFVTVEGATRRRKQGAGLDPVALTADLPAPEMPELREPYDLLVTGVGGTGVVTVGALITMAAHLEAKGASVLDFTGFAQKFGPVLSYIRLAPRPDTIHQVRIDQRSAEAVIGCDVVVTSSPKASATYRPGTRVALNTAAMPTGDIVRRRDASLAIPAREKAIAQAVGEANLSGFDANRAAEKLMGDTVYANVMMLGFAWQKGLIPVGFEALSRAIELNGVAVEANHAAFAYGRIMAEKPEILADRLDPPKPAAKTAQQIIEHRAEFLTGYQDAAYADRYRARLDAFRAALPADIAERLTAIAARSLFKLMAYKDEYEVARLHLDKSFEERIAREFEGGRVKYHLAPPMLPGKDGRGRPLKRQFGPWMRHAYKVLAPMKRLRGTWADPFGHTAERRMERALIAWYEDLMEHAAAEARPETVDRWARILEAAMEIRGYGPVKEEAAARVRAEIDGLLSEPEQARAA